MTLTTQAPDTLLLAAVKQHLYVDIIEDDTLIQSYIDFSLEVTKKYLNDEILETNYTSDNVENNIIIGKYLILNSNYKPYSVTLELSELVPDNILHKSYIDTPSTNLVNTITVYKEYYNYINDELIIDISNIINYNNLTTYITKIVTGKNTVSNSIDMARLILIAGWYATREPSTNLSTNNVPFSVGLILDLESNSII